MPDGALIRQVACEILREGGEPWRRYPEKEQLEAIIASRFGLDSSQVLVTAGADEAIDRVCRAYLDSMREVVLPSPTFEMIERYARLSGARLRRVAWEGAKFPVEEVLAASGQATGVIAIVSPNNPTGSIVTSRELQRISEHARNAIVLLDLAYTEFADYDLTAAGLALPNVVVIRTFSKAWGLAGLRVGYAMASAVPGLIAPLRAAGGPFPVSSISLAVAEHQLISGFDGAEPYVERVRIERDLLVRLLTELGARPLPSHANFVFCRLSDSRQVQMALAEQGIAVRAFPDRCGLHDALRITCPGDAAVFERLCESLREARARYPDAFSGMCKEEET